MKLGRGTFRSLVLSSTLTLAATPPALVNYQGVLRDQNDKPLSGTYDMTFRFLDDPVAGNEILLDQHAAATANAVTVTGGLFGVVLGSGTITDGSGPGTYLSLDKVFRDYGSVWLEVRVGAETLSPRTPIQSSPYALNASQLGGQPAGNFLDTSTTQQAKNGRLNVFNSDTSGFALTGQATATSGVGVYGSGDQYGVEGVTPFGSTGTGVFGQSVYGVGVYGVSSTTAGVWGFSNGTYGGLFQANTYGVYATGNSFGIEAHGQSAGHFVDFANTDTVDLATPGTGVSASAVQTGGSFQASAANGVGVYANGPSKGVWAVGTTNGGTFSAGGAGSIGVSAQATGTGVAGQGGALGGSFSGSGTGSTGIYGSGESYGANFSASGSSGTGVYGYGPATGLRGYGGTVGGGTFGADSGATATLASSTGYGVVGFGPSIGSYFSNGSPWSSYTQIPYQGDGVLAYGSTAGGEFRSFGSNAYAMLSYNSTGVAAYATNAGENPGWFQDLSSGNHASLGQGAYKIIGTGNVSFVQNHPLDPAREIVYTAPEGDEVAVYTRGEARLDHGEASVRLGDTFAWVTNPDIGLTAHLTPVGAWADLYVASVTTTELVVRSRDPSATGIAFDYLVYGLRIGFESRPIVEPKSHESFIPRMDSDEAIYREHPELRAYTALQRHAAMRAAMAGGTSSPDLTKSHALEAAIGRFDPVRDAAALDAPVPSDPKPPPASPEGATTPASASQATPAQRELLLEVAEQVDAGDLLGLDPANPGKLRRAAMAGDGNVVAIAERASTPIEGVEKVAVVTTNYALLKVDAEYGPIHPGDLLVASSNPGYAMVAKGAPSGTVIGKALDPLESGTGTIRVLVIPH